MAGLADFFKGDSTAAQFLLWGVGQQVAGVILLPPLTDVGQRLWSVFPSKALSPPDVADMVVKGILREGDGADEARLNGINPDRFHKMVLDAGQPPDLTFLLEAWRRGYITFATTGPDSVTVEQGVLESHIKDKWIDVIRRMALVPIPAANAVEAVLRGQIPLDQGQTIAYQNGISSDDFTILLNTAGNPPAPQELVEFVRRGFIPLHGTGPNVLSFQQGIFEGDSKNKWEPIFEKLTDYLPPPRTITALERSGAITPTKAQELYRDAGLSPELAAAYSANATTDKVKKHKDLAEAQVVKLYTDQFITRDQALPMLQALGYDPTEATFIFEVADFQRALEALNRAISRIGNLFIGDKIDQTTAIGALNKLLLPPKQVDELMGTWTLERSVSVKLLTEAQVREAFKFGIIGQDEAQQELQALGYTPHDAWTLLSITLKGPQPGEPSRGAVNPVA